MPQLEVLVVKLLSINRFSTGPIATREVAALAHELRDDSVEGRVAIAEAPLTRTEHPEVLRGAGDHVFAQLNDNTTHVGVADANVHKDLGQGDFGLLATRFTVVCSLKRNKNGG